MEQMLKELYEAAVEGNTQTLFNLVQEDALILDRCIVTSYQETPLHIAAMLGHLEFCSELLRRKPELAGELDFRRSSALHLASAKGYKEIVNMLVYVQPDMCLAYDGDGHNPIHVAAMKGRVDVLETLVRVHPDAASAKVRIHQGENVLHLCVQYNQLESLMCLVEAMSDREFVNARDDFGNSTLHLAMAEKQVEIIRFLVSTTPIDIEALNLSGFTALDILAQARRDSKYFEITQCLQHSREQKPPGISSYVSGLRYQSVAIREKHKKKVSICYLDSQSAWVEKQRNSIMVVASLIATMAFQATFAPPGGFWQDDFDGDASKKPHTAGDSILAHHHPYMYERFMFSNTIGFISSLSVILLLISGLPFTHKILMWFLMLIMWISISATAYTYSTSAVSNHQAVKNTLDRFIIIWIAMMALLILVHTIRLLVFNMSSWPLKFKASVWMLMLIVWIPVSVSDKSFLFKGLYGVAEVGFVILICGLILVQSVTFALFFGRKILKFLKIVGGYLSSSPLASTAV